MKKSIVPGFLQEWDVADRFERLYTALELRRSVGDRLERSWSPAVRGGVWED